MLHEYDETDAIPVLGKLYTGAFPPIGLQQRNFIALECYPLPLNEKRVVKIKDLTLYIKYCDIYRGDCLLALDDKPIKYINEQHSPGRLKLKHTSTEYAYRFLHNNGIISISKTTFFHFLRPVE